MIAKLRHFDLNLITVFAIVVIAALPFLTRPALPRHTDLELHVYRAAEYGDVLRDGVLYPRWAPDFYYGYGYPIFNYYAPLTYALAGFLAFIPGVDPVLSVKLIILAAYLLGAYGVYFLARRHFGSSAGVIAAAAFVLSPYFLFIDPLMRGDLAEFFALALLSWVFTVFDQPDRFSAARPLILAAFVMSHNLLAVIGVIMLAAYLIWRGLLIDGVKRWGHDLLSIGLAAALTAIFWLPFLLERNAIRLDVAGPGHFDYHNHFIPLSMLLAPPPPLDLGATAPRFIYNFGLVQWLLFIPAAIFAVLRRRETVGKLALFFVLASAGLAFLIMPLSALLWEKIPPAALIQFPWRLLGPAAFTLSMCAGFVFSRRQEAGSTKQEARGKIREAGSAPSHASRFTRYSLLVAPALTLAALFYFALPTLYPPLWSSDFGDTSPRGMLDFELSGVALGTTSTGDFLPTTVGQVPLPITSLLDSYRAGLIDKFDRSALPPEADVQVETHTAVLDRFRVNSPVEFTGRVLTFLFPGWRVLIDDVEVPIRAADQSGFIEFRIPAGMHRLEAAFSPTAPRLSGALISFAALIALFVISISRRRGVVAVSAARRPAFSLALLFVSLAFLGFKIAVVDRCDACFRYTSPAGQVLGAQYQQPAHFGGHIDLLGYDLPTLEVEAGQVLPLTLYWKATAPVPVNYQVFAHLAQPATVLWGQSDKLNPGDFPTTRWPLNKFVWDDHRLVVLPGTPPGEYQLSVGLYQLESGQRAPVFDDAGQIVADQVTLNVPVRVIAPRVQPSIEALEMQHTTARDYSGLRLLGWSLEAPIVQTPNFARLTLLWQGAGAQAGVNLRAELLDRAGQVAQTVTSNVPVLANGEIRRDQVVFWLPPDFPVGQYTARVTVLDSDGQTLDILDLTSIEVKHE